jgi:hypothetical protein
MRAILVTVIVAATGIALAAEPLRLACEGEARLQNANGETIDKDVLSVTIDLVAKTVTVGSRGAVPIVSNPDADTEVFTEPGSREGVSTGTLNRFTGAASIHIIRTDGLYNFFGTCKPAGKLF